MIVPDRHAIAVVSRAGYWMVLAGFAAWLWSLRETFAADFAGRWRPRPDFPGMLVIASGGLMLLVHEAAGFKIVMDELMLLGTSMSMHLDRTVLTPLRGNDIQGAFEILDGVVDKRPLFFPFLLSLVHDVSGYRPGNAFVLNGVLTFVLLALAWTLGRRLAGRTGGALAVLLLAGLPLLGQNATGGGFELLNLVMILATLLLGVRFVERRDGPSLAAFVLAAVLLSQVRYESVVFLVPVACVVVGVWIRDGRAGLPWLVVAAPLLLIHVPLHQRIFDLRASAWELASKPGFTEPFSFAYVPENLAHALAFFFGRASDQPNSPVLSALGCLAAPLALLGVARWRRDPAGVPAASAVTAVFGLGFLLHFALLMGYFWGRFDDPVIRRLSLPAHLGLVLAILIVLPALPGVIVRRVVLGVAVLGLLVRGVPSMAAH
ncbi:MAG: glycosyltransferase family 39 protein, partial [Opitutaceae bacterium]